MIDDWYEEVARGILIGILSGGAVKFLTDQGFGYWSSIPILIGSFGLVAIAFVKHKKNISSKKLSDLGDSQ